MADYRGFIIILLVIFAIAMTLFLLVEGVRIQPGQFSPFADGTRIRIRSLLNNQYLVRFADINPDAKGFFINDVVFGTPKNNVNNVWVLCQNSGLGLGGSYVIYQESSDTLGLAFPPIDRPVGERHIKVAAVNTCAHNKGETPPPIGSKHKGSNPWIQFRLIENAESPSFGGTVSNAYQIITSDAFWVMSSNGESSSATGNGFEYFGIGIRDDGNTADKRLETSMIIEVVPPR